MIRFFVCALTALCIVASLASRARAATSSLVIHANVVDYYSNRFILTADGNVRARMSDGTMVTGDTFSMDLKLNRFVIAGNVHIDGPTVHVAGAALAGYPDIDRLYFLSEGDVPDRWTYFGNDFSNRHEGREQPGDAFYLPDLGGTPPYIVGKSVTVFPKNNIEFPPGSRLRISGVYTPTPGWVVNFSSNSNFYQNDYSGAVFDIQVPFFGSQNSLSAIDIRYDQVRGAYLSIEQHFVHKADYLVFAINPLTQDERQWNILAYKRESPAVETRLFGQLSTLSTYPWAEPSQSSSYANFQLNSRIGRYASSLNVDQYNNALIPNDNSTFNGALRIDGHPFDIEFSMQSFEDEFRFFRRLGVPLKFQYRAGYGWTHDGYGIVAVNGQPTWNGALYPTISNTFYGLTVYTPSIRIAKQLTISAKSDKERQYYSLPHHVDTVNSTLTLADTPTTTKKPAFFVSYNVLNIGDYYGADQLIAYPPDLGNTACQCGVVANQYGTFSGLDAFRGFATSRSVTGSMVYTPTQYFALNITAQHFDVTPAPVPGLGGSPPYVISADVRVRLTPTLLVDVARSYYFNFGSLVWSPQFTVTLSP